jgi:transcriptional regulator with XRE-family HTH domain
MALTPSQAFGQAIREMRSERHLSQEDAALASGIDRAYYGHIERATKSPTLNTVWRIAAALEAAPSELLRRAEGILDKG